MAEALTCGTTPRVPQRTQRVANNYLKLYNIKIASLRQN